MSTVISGNVKNLVAGAITSRTLVRFTLKGTGGNQPRVNGAALIAPAGGGVEWYADAIPNSSTGAISITLYSTRDAAGTGNGEIECGGFFRHPLSLFQVFLFSSDAMPSQSEKLARALRRRENRLYFRPKLAKSVFPLADSS